MHGGWCKDKKDSGIEIGAILLTIDGNYYQRAIRDRLRPKRNFSLKYFSSLILLFFFIVFFSLLSFFFSPYLFFISLSCHYYYTYINLYTRIYVYSFFISSLLNLFRTFIFRHLSSSLFLNDESVFSFFLSISLSSFFFLLFSLSISIFLFVSFSFQRFPFYYDHGERGKMSALCNDEVRN